MAETDPKRRIVPLVLGVIAAIVVVLLVVIATRPSTFRVERAATIEAPAQSVFVLINDFRQWTRWSPWENRDPAMKKTYSGAPLGQGSVYEWAGNQEVGEGRMTITESHDPSVVRLKLEFIKPFAATNTTQFTLTSTDPGHTLVSWAMEGEHSFVGKAMSLFMDLDKLIGQDFEHGLAAMGAAAKSHP